MRRGPRNFWNGDGVLWRQQRSREGMRRLDLGIRLSRSCFVVSSNVDRSAYLADTDLTVEGIDSILMLHSWFLGFSF